MALPEQRLAFYGFEKTSVNGAWENLARDAAEIDPSGLPHLPSNLTAAQAKRLFSAWVVDTQLTAIEPLLEVTRQRTMDRVAPWALESMACHTAAGYEVGWWSALYPDDAINASAEAVEQARPDIKIEHVYGGLCAKEPDSDLYNGNFVLMPKKRTIKDLKAEGRQFDFTAYSFRSDRDAAHLARHRLVVNPERALEDTPEGQRGDYLHWDLNRPAQTTVRLARKSTPVIFDLNNPGQREAFLHTLRSVHILPTVS